MRRAALYARVSTRRQEQEATIESQLAQLLAYVEEHGYGLLPEHRFIDQAVSGRYLARPGLDRLRDTALLSVFDVLLCLSPDRLARSLGAQQVVLDELRRLGVEVVFVNQPTLGDGPQERLLLNIEGAFAEYERTVISERMRRGRLYSLRQGRSVPTQAPYGYRYHPALNGEASRWIVVAEEATVVEQMFVWYTQDDISLGQLARRLNDGSILGPEGKSWYASTIGRLLRQPAYKGIAYYARHQADYSAVGQPRSQGQGTLRFPRYKRRPSEEWIEIEVPALVDETTWQAAQERLQMKARFAQRNSQRTYLLRGLLVCGVCQHTLQGRTQRDVVYYTCTYGGTHCPPGVARHTCSVRGDLVESLIWQSLSELLRDPQRIQAAWQALQAEEAQTPSDPQRCKKRETLLRKQRERLLDAYQAGVLSLEELTERQNPLDTELKELHRKLATASPFTPLQISLDAFTKRIEHALAASDIQTRQEVLRLLIERIIVTDDTLTVEHIVPTVENDSRLHPTFHAIRSTSCSLGGEAMCKYPRVGVGVIVTKGDHLLLLERKGVHGQGTWSMPGGHLEYGESPEVCAARETKEETGVEIVNVRALGFTNDVFEASGLHYITLWMTGDWVSGEATVAAPYEASAVGWYTWDTLPEPLFLPLRQLIQGTSYPPGIEI